MSEAEKSQKHIESSPKLLGTNSLEKKSTAGSIQQVVQEHRQNLGVDGADQPPNCQETPEQLRMRLILQSERGSSEAQENSAESVQDPPPEAEEGGGGDQGDEDPPADQGNAENIDFGDEVETNIDEKECYILVHHHQIDYGLGDEVLLRFLDPPQHQMIKPGKIKHKNLEKVKNAIKRAHMDLEAPEAAFEPNGGVGGTALSTANLSRKEIKIERIYLEVKHLIDSEPVLTRADARLGLLHPRNDGAGDQVTAIPVEFDHLLSKDLLLSKIEPNKIFSDNEVMKAHFCVVRFKEDQGWPKLGGKLAIIRYSVNLVSENHSDLSSLSSNLSRRGFDLIDSGEPEDMPIDQGGPFKRLKTRSVTWNFSGQ